MEYLVLAPGFMLIGILLFLAVGSPKPGCDECRKWNDERKYLKAKLRRHCKGNRAGTGNPSS